MGSAEECKFTQYSVPDFHSGILHCKNCLKCPPGFEAEPPCPSGVKPHLIHQSCKPCRLNHFKSTHDEFGCKACLSCVDDREYKSNCTPISDSKCASKCAVGTYFGKDEICRPCCRCHTGQNQFQPLCLNAPGQVREGNIFFAWLK